MVRRQCCLLENALSGIQGLLVLYSFDRSAMLSIMEVLCSQLDFTLFVSHLFPIYVFYRHVERKVSYVSLGSSAYRCYINSKYYSSISQKHQSFNKNLQKWQNSHHLNLATFLLVCNITLPSNFTSNGVIKSDII